MSGYKPSGRHQERRLTAAAVRSIKEPGLYGDGHGLYLKVDKSGARRWVQRLVIQGKRRDIGLGSYTLVSIVEAREAALQHRKQARAGIDPLAEKRRSSSILTFEGAARKVHELRAPTWKNGKHGKQWLSTLETHVFPVFGTKQIDTINSSDLLSALTPIWNKNPETARRIKQRIGVVLQYAMGQGWRTDDPSIGLKQVLPRHDRSKIERRRALPYTEVGAALATVDASKASTASKLAFALLVHTASRSTEVREAVWGEFDLAKAVWVVPGARMKGKKEHRVPLSAPVISLIEQAKALRRTGTDLLFPSVTGRALSDATLSKLVRELGIDAVPHGFRSSFRDWAAEQTNHPTQVAEFALAHVIKDKAEAAYARSDLFERRKILMSEWSSYLTESKRGQSVSGQKTIGAFQDILDVSSSFRAC